MASEEGGGCSGAEEGGGGMGGGGSSGAAAAATAAAAEPRSWGELCNSYRSTWGAGAMSTVDAARQDGSYVAQRFARTVPSMCPLAEGRHLLFATGEPPHAPSERRRGVEGVRAELCSTNTRVAQAL